MKQLLRVFGLTTAICLATLAATPAMAAEVARLYATTDLAQRRIFSMGGHEDGIFTFGASAEDAGDLLMAALAAAQSMPMP